MKSRSSRARAAVAATVLLIAACDRSAAPTENASTAGPSGIGASASVPAPTTPAARIYASRDGGRSWQASDAGLSDGAAVNAFAASGGDVFAGTMSGGVFVSRDAGRTWAVAIDVLGKGSSVNAMAASADVVLAGTRSEGVFASRDRGRRWRPANDGLTSLEIRRLAADGRRFFAATNRGLFVTEDGAASWRHLIGDGQTNGVVSVRGRLYVADVSGVLRSSDEGRTWRRVYDGATPHDLGTDGDAVFAMLYGRGVVRTDDAGDTWRSAQAGLPADLGQYTFQIVAAGDALYAGQWRGVYVSDTKGEAWRLVGEGLSPEQAIMDIIRVEPGVLLAGAVVSKPKD